MSSTSSPSRIILVTGANRGIGNGIVQRLVAKAPSPTSSDEGKKWTIILACRTKRSAEEAIQSFNASIIDNVSLEPLELELGSDESILAAKRSVEERFGHVDVLINNAGSVTRVNPTNPSSETNNLRAHFVETYNINVASVALTIDTFLPLPQRSPDARIINLASQTGSLAFAAGTDFFLTEEVGYSVAKAALNRLTIELWKMYRDKGISFYCACPGYCRTGLTKYTGLKDPVEGARVVEELVLAEKGRFPFGFYAFEDGEMRTYQW